MEPDIALQLSWSQHYCFITTQIAQNVDLSLVHFPWERYISEKYKALLDIQKFNRKAKGNKTFIHS